MWNRIVIIFFIFLFGFLLSGCNSNLLPGMQNLNISNMRVVEPGCSLYVTPTLVPISTSLLATDPPPPYIYHVSPQDVLSVVVWQHPEFNPPIQQLAVVAGSLSSQAAGQSGYLVNSLGDIYFPLIGRIHVAGHTVERIRVDITKRLRMYVRNPQVIVRVADFRSKKIYVLGEVRHPGLLPLNDQPMTITDAITFSGSFVPEAADTGHIYVIRGPFITPTIYWLRANTPDALLLAENFQLQPNDIVYVSSAAIVRWNRVMNQLLPTFATIYFTKTITGK